MSKHAPYTYGTENTDGTPKKVWRSLNEFAGTTEFKEALAREFPDGASELNDEMSRRNFLGLMGASIGLAGLTACQRPEEKILPYAHAPEQITPGVAQYYATAMAWSGTAIGLLVESHDGRPTKIEGNPLHPDSLGAASAYAQAEILNLFDPNRSSNPREKGEYRTWDQAAAYLRNRLDAASHNRGKGFAILAESGRSVSLQFAIENFQHVNPMARAYRFDPFSRFNSREGARIALGKPLERLYHVEKAKVLVALDSDFLHGEGSSLKQANAFATNRRLEGGVEMNRLYSVESAFSVTGAAADHRLRLQSQRVPAFVIALARALVQGGVAINSAVMAAVEPSAGKLPEGADRFIQALAKDLIANKGESLLITGERQPSTVHALVVYINDALGNIGKTVTFVPALDESMDGTAQRMSLIDSMNRGDIDTLLILGGNPVLNAPGDLEFLKALSHVQHTIHLSTHVDETSASVGWHLPRTHFLEAWDDCRAEDGTIAIVQPLIAPLHDTRTDSEVIDLVLNRNRKAYQIVREFWEHVAGADFAKLWRKALHDGVWPDTALVAQSVAVRSEGAAELTHFPAIADGIEVTFRPDSHAWDGRYANCGWLQEMPDPMTKLTWDNAALVSPATARRLEVKDGQFIELTSKGNKVNNTVRIPILVAPGQADDSIALTVGQGRTDGLNKHLGREGKPWSADLPKTPGFDCYPLRAAQSNDWVSGIQYSVTSDMYTLAMTQEHHNMEGRALVREANLTKYREDKDFAKKAVEFPRTNMETGKEGHNGGLLSVFYEHKYEGHKWGMVIDLNACIGCNACMVACQSENNIPLVGKQGVINSREMHWIRIDRYYTGDNTDDVQAVVQPIPCQQCEDAPCETVCPVAATTHSPEGLNDMAYNRCVGTRYCANNCPFKVRRFNFLNYNKAVPELRKMHMNPDVTVRSRGVMEKCTYCVQRINRAKIISKQAGHEDMVREKKRITDQNGVEQDVWLLKDGNITTACQQTCPTKAITFGDLNDSNSRVTQLAGLPRDYKMLEELNIRPRTSYLAKVRNPNPELA